MRSEPPVRPALLRELIGESLREERVAQGKTLREVSKAARVSPLFGLTQRGPPSSPSTWTIVSLAGARSPNSFSCAMSWSAFASASRVAVPDR